MIFSCALKATVYTRATQNNPLYLAMYFLRTVMSTHHNWFHAQPGDEEEHNKSTGRLDRQDPKKIGQVQPIPLFRSIGFSVSASQNLGFFGKKKYVDVGRHQPDFLPTSMAIEGTC